MLMVAITLDVIWYARNEVVHGKDKPDPFALIYDIQRRYEDNEAAWSLKE